MLKKRANSSSIDLKDSSVEILSTNPETQNQQNSQQSITSESKRQQKLLQKQLKQFLFEPRRTSQRRKIQSSKFVDESTKPLGSNLKSRQNAQKQSFRDEQRQLYQAIKNSMIETKNSINNLDELEEMPVFHPTEEEFSDPFAYIEKLYYHYKAEEYGTVKIIPPNSFKPQCVFDTNSDRKYPTRYQVLQKLSQGVPFHQNTKGHTYQQFKKIAQEREIEDQDIDWTNDKQIYDRIEKEYWDMVENQVGNNTKVEYAADLNASTYGNGFGMKTMPNLTEEQKKYVDHPWNFANFQQNKNSLLQFKNCKPMSGINTPWMYVGMKYSTFCWHFEDLMLPSINFCHAGKPKLWYGVPLSHREKFDRAVKEKCSLLFKKDPNILLDVITMISPSFLKSQGVKICKTLQRPGEMIITFPGSYHAGFSTGLNIGEAVNFATYNWCEYGMKCQAIYRASRERIPIFPIEWVMIENIKEINSLDLGLKELEAIQKTFQIYLLEEIKSRRKMENFIKQYYIGQGLNANENLKNHISYIENRDEVDEDHYACKYCTDHCFLSMITCKMHTLVGFFDKDRKLSIQDGESTKKENLGKYESRQSSLQQAADAQQYCVNHQNYCQCPIPNYSLIYRYSTRELDAFMSKITHAVEQERLKVRTQISDDVQIITVKDDSKEKRKNSQSSQNSNKSKNSNKSRRSERSKSNQVSNSSEKNLEEEHKSKF